MPCLLSDNKSENLLRCDLQNFKVIELILGFDDNVLPAGLYHQLAVRFAANSPQGYIPVFHRYCARVLVARKEVIIEEDFMCGVINLHICVRKKRLRADFEEAYTFLKGIIADVIEGHWSKRSLFYLVPKCTTDFMMDLISNQSGPISHGIRNIPNFNSQPPETEYEIQCNHRIHGRDGGRVDVAAIKEYWFSDVSNPDSMTPNEYPLTNQTDLSIDDGKGAIMISYSWGLIDMSTKLYPNQERAKRLATAMEKYGYKVWIDTRYMRGNMFYKMGTVITNCKALIACVSTEYHKVDNNADKEFSYACGLKQKIYGVKLAKNTNMMDGAYGFHKGFKDKFYNLADCSSDAEYDAVVDELVRDLKMDGVV
ncbi:hypothetical protein HK098_002907 [Nowakowskiella sp. JEL0407]|nr:hypothetical protein HK098_002907 [Nowakowskiella sp. JEL0407]